MIIGIVDYEAGNIRSVVNALKTLRVSYLVSNKQEELSIASKIILPGVGEARSAMESLHSIHLVEWLKTLDVPFLGICLGMQILFERSTERDISCLGIIEGTIEHFAKVNAALKVPHMGWNDVMFSTNSPLFEGIRQGEFFYFVHSYYAPLTSCTIGETDYGIRFSAAVQKNNYYGVQFHPEKSGNTGLQILKNFVERC